LQHGVLTPELRDWAIATIASGAPLGRWDWDGVRPEKVGARKELLERYKEMLLRVTATPEELESVTTPEAFSERHPSGYACLSLVGPQHELHLGRLRHWQFQLVSGEMKRRFLGSIV
jgi:hypothetical protein